MNKKSSKMSTVVSIVQLKPTSSKKTGASLSAIVRASRIRCSKVLLAIQRYAGLSSRNFPLVDGTYCSI